MDKRLVDWSLRYRFLVLIGMACVLVYGSYAYTQLPVDAFPDISPVMVPVFAEAHGMAPEEVERLVTFPIESAMNGLPGVTQIKSTSAFGMAVIYVYFRDDVDIYFARQIVAERLSQAMADLPEMDEPPMLGPISTGLGQVFIYYLTLEEGAETDGKDRLTYLREVNDWIVKYQLQTVGGVTDILSIGGHVLQYQIRVDPYALAKFAVSLEDVVAAVQDNNANAGGQFLLLGSEEHLVRGIGLATTLDDLRDIHVKVDNGIPVKIGDIAQVAYGQEIRRGVVSRNGEEEVVSGIVLQLYGQNTSKVIERLYDKVPAIQASLPDGVNLVPYYEQAELVTQATWTVKKALLQGGGLVLIVLFLFLGHLGSAGIVALALPLSALVAVIGMRLGGVSANLMSLGGIAIGIGMLADGAIVMVENIYRHLGSDHDGRTRHRTDVILEAAREVSRPIIFSTGIIILVFIPIFTLEGVEGKMFSPVAFTVACALLGSMAVATIVAPALSTYLLRGNSKKESTGLRLLTRVYQPAVEWAVRHKAIVTIVVIVAFAASMAMVPHLGTEFIPALEEGSILIGVTMAPSIALDKGVEVVQQLERKILDFNEVDEVISRIGRPEAGSHPHPVNYAEVHIELKPQDQWANHQTKQQLIESLNKALSVYPGVQLNFTQPIQNAFDELLSGIKAQVAIKVFGEDLDVLRDTATEVRNAIDTVPGLVDLAVEQSFGQPQVQIVANRDACARYGVSVAEVLELVELAIGGEVVDHVYLNTRRFGIHVRYQEAHRSDPQAIENLLVHSQGGTLIPLKQVATVRQVVGPIQINREKNQRRWVIQGNIRGRDMGSVIDDIQSRIGKSVTLPPGYYVEYGGQFESQRRAMTRLSIIVPVVLGVVFVLLCMAFGSLRSALLIIINVPLALMGGIVGLYVMQEYLSVPAAIGFIALFGIAVQNGVVLVSHIDQLRASGIDTTAAVITGSARRLRPVLMTASTTVLGLLPLLLSSGTGSEVQRPLATVVVFGLTSATLLTLFVIPALYPWFAPSRQQES